MALSGRSTHCSRSALKRRQGQFFEPGELGGEPANLGKQIFLLLLIRGAEGGHGVGFGKETGQASQSGRPPIPQDVRMDVVVGGQLGQRFGFL